MPAHPNIQYLPDFLPPPDADRLYTQLLDGIAWQQDRISLFGREHPIPRLHQWYADDGLNYRWSGLDMQPQGWNRSLEEVRMAVADYCNHPFNSVLANLYRDGNDSMGWHADDESELGVRPLIASISLGAARDFQLRRKDRQGETQTVLLEHGSLLLMSGEVQHDWQHAVPKRKRVTEPRINLTFRQIIPAA